MTIIISGTIDIDSAQMAAAMEAGRPLIEGAPLLVDPGLAPADVLGDLVNPALDRVLTEGRIRISCRISSTENALRTRGIAQIESPGQSTPMMP